MRKMSTKAWVVPAVAAILMFWVCSGAANYFFGRSLGTDEPFVFLGWSTTTSQLFSYVSLSSDILKAIMLFAVGAALMLRQWLTAFVCASIWLACTVWSIASAVGFVALNSSTVTDTRGQTADEWASLRSEIRRTEERRSWIPEARPAETVKAEIIGLENAVTYHQTASCTNATIPDSMKFCDSLAKLRQEYANAQSARDLDAQLATLRQEMKGSRRVSSANPFADMVASLLDIKQGQAVTGQALFLAALLELISSLGLWAVIRSASGSAQDALPRPKSKEATLAPVDVLSPVTPQPSPPESRAPAPVPLVRETFIKPVNLPAAPTGPNIVDFPKAKDFFEAGAPVRKKGKTPRTPEGMVKEFLADCTELEDGASTSTADLYREYEAWCEETGHAKLGHKKFSAIASRLTGRTKEMRDVGGSRFPVVIRQRMKKVATA